jgi:ClpP class serine protease
VEAVEVLADGSSMSGARALDAGLVDAIGDQQTAREWFANELGMNPEDVIFCENVY